MNGITEPLPGLLDDPLFQLPDLPALTDIQIAPLRNPAPSRHANVPLPLEPVADNSLNNGRTNKNTTHPADSPETRRTPKITPNDVLLAREAKRPHLAISELLEADHGPDFAPTYLPSFISLSVVEKSPVQTPSFVEPPYSLRRLRLDTDNDHGTLDWTRHLPPPAQKEDRQSRPAPLLPAMVTGLHEPPPSAALLPSIDLDSIHAVVAGQHELAPSAPLLRSTDFDPIHSTATGLHELPPHSAAPLPPIDTELIHATGLQEPPLSAALLPPVDPDSTYTAVTGPHEPPHSAALLQSIDSDPTHGTITGLHEPPPSAALLPSIDLDSIPAIARQTTTSRIHVRDMLTESSQPDPAPPAAPSPPAASSGPLVDRLAVPNQQDTGNYPTPPEEVRDHVPRVIPPVRPPWKAGPMRGPNNRRPRRKWTGTETADLMAGVSKYGIGRWKQIVDDPSFNFGDRSAVDLKDRYRVCVNEKPSTKADTNLRADSPIAEASPSIEILGIRQCRERGAAINSTPKRRKRRAWTEEEDNNLLGGVARHGFQWTAIHDDPDLNLSHRRATDLRDRIRNRFPDGYKHAEFAPSKREARNAIRAEKEALADQPIPWDVVVPGREYEGTRIERGRWEEITSTDDSTPTSAGSNDATTSVTRVTGDVDKENEIRQDENEKERDRDREKEQQQQQPLITLPSFSLGFFDDMDWEDNTLPPMHDGDDSSD
ncbi:uncharacterized protein A1O5_11776 [Cladophialophora psammophila CBS 110553]|uniref:Myb-like domain-containing protein n=1 Tax=Cladophialophora psammophila CBS 110553 TaxID=1182543 RepID=W9W900_9EURO|nr:uncharacterized protein A1O5_11776 [Cladophialophora psammophila CBS 110553]EXJ61460.1 hypothetical protein A1O5_11776 [Cladophialophora psammophila CBS 110553]